jgi:hypothetical protein
MPELPTSLAKLPTETPPVPDATAATRVKRAADVVSQFQTLFNEDYIASRDRAVVQSMADRQPPYSDDVLRKLGIAGITNVNWGDLGIAQQEAEKPFNSVLMSMSHFGIVPFKRRAINDGIVPESDAEGMQMVVAEERPFYGFHGEYACMRVCLCVRTGGKRVVHAANQLTNSC